MGITPRLKGPVSGAETRPIRAFEQRHSQLLLEFPDLRAESRLADMTCRGGPAEMFRVVKGNEVAKVLKSHRHVTRGSRSDRPDDSLEAASSLESRAITCTVSDRHVGSTSPEATRALLVAGRVGS